MEWSGDRKGHIVGCIITEELHLFRLFPSTLSIRPEGRSITVQVYSEKEKF